MNEISRKEFLQKTGIGALALALFGLQSKNRVFAGLSDNISDNLGASGAGIKISDAEPTHAEGLWIDTSMGGVCKYYNGTTWKPVKSTWS